MEAIYVGELNHGICVRIKFCTPARKMTTICTHELCANLQGP